MQQKPQVLITGASGFIGQHLAAYLTQQGYQVIGLTRNPSRSSSQADLRYIHRLEQISQEPIDYVINLAGENIGQSRWTEKRKLELINSRIETTRQVFEWLQQNRIQPHRIISVSAIGYYGIDPQEQWSGYCNESSPPQDIFMSELCQRWEHQAKNNPGQQVSIIRLGVVFARNGGILPQMLMPIRFNLVGKIGHGRQPVTWIHINDVVRAITFILQQRKAKAVYNLVAPEQATQRKFAEIAAAKLYKKPLLSMPACVMKTMLGEQSQLVLNGQFVMPQALLEQGFEFQYPDLNSALTDLLDEK
ncbi:TIGR01777 family oxidoreductase [Acinetobacter radioresistens]|uniref:TIGR01777 family oxidoreductase n=1 Tax=Acinetobacter radioresistens TaxID=40216 RepID=UPI0020037B40|nr:TIGR01777 family oxidoreductase [Acinetobacter radioresistens]MCX0331529.1 TIGR01777 family oxidoreductase [Acinetobacter radioresistens]